MTTQFLTPFSCSKVYVSYPDDGYWNVSVKVSLFRCKQLFYLFTLTTPNTE